MNLNLLNPRLGLFSLSKLDLDPVGYIWDYSIDVQTGKAEVMARILSLGVVWGPPPLLQRQRMWCDCDIFLSFGNFPNILNAL